MLVPLVLAAILAWGGSSPAYAAPCPGIPEKSCWSAANAHIPATLATAVYSWDDGPCGELVTYFAERTVGEIISTGPVITVPLSVLERSDCEVSAECASASLFLAISSELSSPGHSGAEGWTKGNFDFKVRRVGGGATSHEVPVKPRLFLARFRECEGAQAHCRLQLFYDIYRVRADGGDGVHEAQEALLIEDGHAILGTNDLEPREISLSGEIPWATTSLIPGKTYRFYYGLQAVLWSQEPPFTEILDVRFGFGGGPLQAPLGRREQEVDSLAFVVPNGYEVSGPVFAANQFVGDYASEPARTFLAPEPARPAQVAIGVLVMLLHARTRRGAVRGTTSAPRRG